MADVAEGRASADPALTRVRLRIRDADGRPTGLRLRVTDGDGAYWPPLGHLPIPDTDSRAAGDLILGDGGAVPFELHALVHDGAEIDLVPGRYHIHARRGFEHEILRLEVDIGAGGGQVVELSPPRFANLEAEGWFSGDTHAHHPDPAGIRYEMEAEGLQVCSLLVMKGGLANPPRPGDGFFWNVEHFTGRPAVESGARHVIQVGEEFRHSRLAHLVMQDLRSIVWPVSTGGLPESGAGGFDWPLMWHAAGEARGQGAIVSWAHWPYPSMEAPLDIALGQVDSIDLLTVGNPFEPHPDLTEIYRMRGPEVYSLPPIEVYYHYLACGFRLAVTAGSDKMGPYPPLGGARTYVRVEGDLSYGSWVDGIRQGRTFVSTYPLLELSVEGQGPGASLARLRGERLSVTVSALSLEPYDVLQVIQDGRVVASAAPAGDRHEARIEAILDVDRDGWIAARAHGRTMLEYGPTWRRIPVFAHTSPIYIKVPGRPAEAGESARLFLEQLGFLERWVDGEAHLPSPGDRLEAHSLIDRAADVYRRLAEL